jgi:hypothetical protein
MWAQRERKGEIVLKLEVWGLFSRDLWSFFERDWICSTDKDGLEGSSIIPSSSSIFSLRRYCSRSSLISLSFCSISTNLDDRFDCLVLADITKIINYL